MHNTQKKDRKRRDLIKKEEGDTVRHIDREIDIWIIPNHL